MKKVLFFHTTMNTPDLMKKAFLKRFPDASVINLVDDSVLPEVSENGNKYTKAIVERLIAYANIGESMGASVAVCMCTTITGAVYEASKQIKIPFVTIDRPMLEKAVQSGNSVALLVTAKTTLDASDASIKQVAKELGSRAAVDTIFIPNASDALNQEHNKTKHDQLIAAAAEEAAKNYDVVVLAQATMANAAKLIRTKDAIVLTSVESGLEQLEKYLC